jgi:hypothetical protein
MKASEHQDALVSGCREAIKTIGKIAIWSLSTASLFTSANFGAHWPLKFYDWQISKKWAYNVCGFVLFAASLAVVVQAQKMCRLVRSMNRESWNQLRIDTSFWNVFADFGTAPADRLLSCQALSAFIVIFWFCYSAISLLNPYEWSMDFELMLLGAGILFLCSVTSCRTAMRDVSSQTKALFKLPVLGSVTVEDVIIAGAAAIGGSIALMASAIAPRLPH